jgi:hypothetical protein
MKFLALTVVIAVLVAVFVSNESHALPACVSSCLSLSQIQSAGG